MFLGFMLDNPLLTTVGSLIGVSGSILSYIMVRILSIRAPNLRNNVVEALENADNVILVCSLYRPFCCNLT